MAEAYHNRVRVLLVARALLNALAPMFPILLSWSLGQSCTRVKEVKVRIQMTRHVQGHMGIP